ncbi:MAG: hypothetical protein MUO62_02995 [Anaerolineales bacterium]|nr:hypothetical protein [Anaerolineales bacterium]
MLRSWISTIVFCKDETPVEISGWARATFKASKDPAAAAPNAAVAPGLLALEIGIETDEAAGFRILLSPGVGGAGTFGIRFIGRDEGLTTGRGRVCAFAAVI